MQTPVVHRFMPALVEVVVKIVGVLERMAAAPLDLLIRLWLAQVFVLSAVLKLAQWDNALYLAAHEYPVSWLDPRTAAWVGATTELLGGLLLAAGLATRAAAFALLVLALVIHANYLALDVTLLWAALLGWYVVRGAGTLSLDHLIAPGLAVSPLPWVATALRWAAAVTRHGAPVYLLLLRAWMAAALLLMGGMPSPGHFSEWLPWQSIQMAIPGWHVPIAVLLIAGLATRPVALVALLATFTAMMMDSVRPVEAWWPLLFGLLAMQGAGSWSLDALIVRVLRDRYPQLQGKPAFSLEGLPRVVIIGAGFGGLACAGRLKHEAVSVTLIDRHNYHLFQPLLYQVATAGLSPGDIATPIRGLFRDSFNTRVLYAEVNGVDTAAQTVQCGSLQVPYDYLVIATGASHSYFGKDQWAPFAPGLKRVEDSTEVRRRVLSAFERAEATEDAGERRELLNFLIVGAGPTGVELAGAIAEMARHGMQKDFRRFDPASARVMLVQSGERILPAFDATLSRRAQLALEQLGVEVLLNSRVEVIDAGGVTVNGRRIAARTVLWAAGVVASPAARWLGVPADNAGRLKVEPDLSVPGHRNIYCVGDTALSLGWNGQPVPGLAPAAKQGGQYVARVLRARLRGNSLPGPFVYRHLGSLATIGRKAAVADFGVVKLSGAPAWWLWGLVHVGFLVGVRNRVSVMLDWFWSYLTLRSGTRLITGGPSGVHVAVDSGSSDRRVDPVSPLARSLASLSPRERERG